MATYFEWFNALRDFFILEAGDGEPQHENDTDHA